MKKLIIILGLLLATSVAFGKPAYKQWKSDAYRQSWDSDDIVINGFLRLRADYFSDKKKPQDKVVIAYYIDTNKIDNGKVRLIITMLTSVPLDFSVGVNEAVFRKNNDEVTNVLMGNERFVDGYYTYSANLGWVTTDDLKGGISACILRIKLEVIRA